MVTAQFNAFCPLEIGDEIRDTTGGVHTVTDIACIHYVRTGKVEFRFELDGTGYYAPIEIQDAPPRIRAIRIWGYPPEKKPATGTVKENAIHPQATDADRVLRTIENYPLTVEDVEIYARFCEETGIHGKNLTDFLREAITAKRKKRF